MNLFLSSRRFLPHSGRLKACRPSFLDQVRLLSCDSDDDDSNSSSKPKKPNTSLIRKRQGIKFKSDEESVISDSDSDISAKSDSISITIDDQNNAMAKFQVPKPDTSLIFPTPNRPVFPGFRNTLIFGNALLAQEIQSILPNRLFMTVCFSKDLDQDALDDEDEEFCSKDFAPIGTFCEVLGINPIYGPKLSDSYMGRRREESEPPQSPITGYRLEVLGHRRVEVGNFDKKEMPIYTDIKHLKDVNVDKDSSEMGAQIGEIMTTFKDIFRLNPLHGESINLAYVQFNRRDAGSICDFAASMSFGSPSDIQEVLESVDVNERVQKTLLLLKKDVETLKVQKDIGAEIEKKASETHRKHYLKQQLKQIQEELGYNKDDKRVLIEKFEDRFAELQEIGQEHDVDFPQAAEKAIEEEIQKLSSLDQDSSEFNYSRRYLEWLLHVPWTAFSTDNYDLAKATKILEADHYGLEDVKERILEYIAVGNLKGELNGKILLLVGPPGVGKTSIGKSIAKALEREFFRFSVGGLSDVSEIKGHRRTYVGSMPGKIIQCLKQTQTMNPLILVDEIDKLSTGYRGDPSSALLELLDPSQNTSFVDHYLDVPVDVSKVLFVCTANMTDTIPPPLLDRMEVVRLSGYDLPEKVEIAKSYLVPRAKKEAGLFLDDVVVESTPTSDENPEAATLPKEKKVKVDVNIAKNALESLARWYCREAGVRKLQQHIERIYRKIAFMLVRDSSKEELVPIATKRKRKEASFKIPDSGEFMIEDEFLEDLVGKPVFQSDRLYEESVPPGVVMGLAWTAYGGTSLYIETTNVKATKPKDSKSKTGNTGKLVVTGQLGDVMKESTTIAYTNAKHILSLRDPTNTFFEDNEVHLHVPEGATPKDGPSAGVTMTTALLGLAMNKSISADLAMTGEISLTGKVLPVGGIKEKIIAARRSGIKQIILPDANRKDADDLPDYLLDEIDINFAKTYDEVFSIAFKPGPKLNLIIGANGSGKSSILCAISLGLGGEPKDLGRSNQVSAYIKNDCAESSVEIELFEPAPMKKNPVVKRVMRHGESDNSRGLSTWFWNDEEKPQKFVVEMLRKYQINVGNLCQILPQDRVGDFSKFDTVKLLDETIRATLSEKEIDKKHEIYRLTDKRKVDMGVKLRKEREFEKATKENERLEERVSHLKERKEIEDQLTILRRLRPWCEYQAKEVNIARAKKEAKTLENEIKSAENERKECKKLAKDNVDEVNGLKSFALEQKNQLRDSLGLLFDFTKGLNKSTSRSSIIFEELEAIVQEKDNVESNIANCEAEIENIQETLRNSESVEELGKKLRELRDAFKPVEGQSIKLKGQLAIASEKFEHMKQEMASLNRAQSKMNNEADKRMQFLRYACGEESARAHHGIHSAIKNGNFDKPILGPVFLEVVVKKPLFAQYTEMLVGRSTLSSYITQSSRDRSQLIKSKQNVLNVEVANESQLLIRKTRKLRDLTGAEKLLKMGIEGFGFEFLAGEELVNEALVRITNLAKVLFATSAFEDLLERVNPNDVYNQIANVVGDTFQVYSPKFLHLRKVSRYGKRAVMIETKPYVFVGKALNRSSIFYRCYKNVNSDTSFGSSVNDKDLVEKQKQFEEAQSSCSELEQTISQLDLERKDIKSKMNSAKQSRNSLLYLKQKLDAKKDDLETAVQERERDFDGDQKILERKAFEHLEKCKKLVDGKATTFSTELVGTTNVFNDSFMDLSTSLFNGAFLKGHLKHLKKQEKNHRRALEFQMKTIEKDQKVAEKMKKVLEKDIPIEMYKEEFKKQDCRTTAQIDQKTLDLEAELTSKVSDPSILLEFDTNRKKMLALKPELESLIMELEITEKDLSDQTGAFEIAVQEKVEIINDKYKEMFALIQQAGFKCDGEVRFLKNRDRGPAATEDSKYNFQNATSDDGDGQYIAQRLEYGIGIFVRFRDGNQLELLNAEVQSGGERSLSTFLYLLSLQECSSAPFRVVDEINQGMDAEKERLAFHCLVENSGRDEIPQYFLITPKLLTGLDYNDTVQVNFVNNGFFAPRQQIIDLKRVIRDLKKQQLADDDSVDNDSNMENTPESDLFENNVAEIKSEQKRRKIQ